MAARNTPPFRADHVGSLLRPPKVLRARADHRAGSINDEQLRTVEDAAVRNVVRMQEDVGLRSATDGELRRSSWHMDFIYRLGGVRTLEGTTTVKFRNAQGELAFRPAAHRIDGPIVLNEPIFADAFAFLQDVVTSAVPKLTIPSPSMVHYRGGRAAIDESVYPSLDEFWSDLTSAYADEVAALYGHGCRYLQFDDVSLAYLNDPRQREHVREIGGDPDRQHIEYIRHINESLAAKPRDMAVTTHMCRGNFQSSWIAEGGYDHVAEALFNELDVDGFFMEWDDERSGGFEPLRFVPPGKVVVLGLVTTKRGDLENPDHVKRRVEAASRYVDIDQLCLSPQCGFASTFEGNALAYEQQVAKLGLIVECATDIWG